MNVGAVSLGCAKNQVDTENMLGLLRAAGFGIVSDPEEADILIVNTCGFILPAKEESIETIFEMAQYKKAGTCRLLVVTGCLSERYRKELTEEMPEVDLFLGVREYDKLPRLLAEKLHTPCLSVEHANRLLVSPPYRAYLRVGDGCNNRCTYCAIPLIRGNLNSVPIERLIDEAKRLADNGVTELS
ncbi:MAG: 30S ribosomal protein S12 methylthiotransferase RimO, partial [Clostridia bacterium]|nr:30S ribosomal protein S12 methylthiotransferase RimO [Clostridia bacterium]